MPVLGSEMNGRDAIVVSRRHERACAIDRCAQRFPKRGEIDLAGDVVITSRDTGLVMTSQAITANLDAGEMISEEAVRVENDNGFVVADSMQVKDRGDRIVFAGNPRLTLRDVGSAQ